MMIAHVSMPADDCQAVARVLAELMEGSAVCFPPGGPGAWNAWSKQDDLQIVVTPRGHYMVPGPGDMEWVARTGSVRASETHFALCVERPASDIIAIAERAGWPARLCDRGGFFHVVEIWVEGAYLIELLDPAFTAEYQHSMTLTTWRERFGEDRSH